MAVPGEQESFKSQSFSKPSKSTSTPTRTGTNFAMAQGKGSMPTKEATRRVFFDNRPDISDDRLERRQKQFDELRAFKNDPTKTKAVNIVDPVTGKVTGTVTGLTQAATAGGKTVTQREQELAFKYGPTFSEIASDVTYAGGEVLGALGERAMSGGLGFLGAIKEVANYALDKANKGYDKLNPVQQEIFDNPNKYPFASNISSIDAVNSSKNLALEAQRDVLGLGALEASAADATNTSAVGGGGLSSFVNEPIGTFGGSTMGPRVAVRDIQKEQLDAMDIGYVESGQFRKDLQKSGILSVDDPSTQEPLPDSTEIPGYNATIGILKERLKDQGLDEIQIQSAVNEVTQQILSGEFTGDFEVETGSTTRGSELKANEPGGKPGGGLIMPTDQSGSLTDMLENSQVSVTEYNNPVNLMDVGQAGATGETYGKGFAVFPDAQTGILAAKNDLAIKTERYGGNVDEIIGEFSPRSDNPDSFDNYVNFVKQGVGDTVDPGEEDELLRRVIQFENKPEIANQYLAMVANGGMIDKELTNLQNGLQNMYNGIPSVRRR